MQSPPGQARLIGLPPGLLRVHPSSEVLVMAPVPGSKMVLPAGLGSMFGSNHGFTHVVATGLFPAAFTPEGL